jgi:hypothetical protein
VPYSSPVARMRAEHSDTVQRLQRELADAASTAQSNEGHAHHMSLEVSETLARTKARLAQLAALVGVSLGADSSAGLPEVELDYLVERALPMRVPV